MDTAGVNSPRYICPALPVASFTAETCVNGPTVSNQVSELNLSLCCHK